MSCETGLWPEGVCDSIAREAGLIKIAYLPIAGVAFILRFLSRHKRCGQTFKNKMAFYILINKVSETADEAVCEFWEDETDVGCLKLDKIAGGITELRQIHAANSEAVFTRASWKVLPHSLAGEFPERTCWAS